MIRGQSRPVGEGVLDFGGDAVLIGDMGLPRQRVDHRGLARLGGKAMEIVDQAGGGVGENLVRVCIVHGIQI